MKTLQQYVRRWSKQKGDAIVWKHGYRVYRTTYKELGHDAYRIATFLCRLKKGDKLILWGPNSPTWVKVFFACVLRGIVVVPIDHIAEADFVERVRKQCRPKLMVCHESHKGKVSMKTFTMEQIVQKAQGLDPIRPPQVRPSDTVEIVYTSGTTGDPKGVVLTHENLVSNIQGTLKTINLSSDTAVLCLVPLSHMLGQATGMFIPFALNAQAAYLLVVSSRTVTNMLQRERLTMLAGVPRMLRAMRDRIEWEASRVQSMYLRIAQSLSAVMPWGVRRLLFAPLHRELGGLDYHIIGGAALDQELETWWDRTGVPVLQGYGLTETAPIVSFNPPQQKRVGSVGKPLVNCEVRVAIDEEICVRGPNVFTGYYKRPEKTKDSFIKGWFKTGDVGYLEDDYLYYKGRKKDMIVTSEGMNVYPEDVERVLEGISGVRECAVVGYPEFNERVHAFLILEPDTDPKQVLEQANAQLASHQQIQGYTVWPEPTFPRTTTQKVQKYKLITYLESEEGDASPAKDPLTRVISEVTGARPEEITPEAQLSRDLQCSSLDRVELLARIEEELHVALDETVIGADTTVGELHAQVEGGAKRKYEYRIRRWVRSGEVQALRQVVQPALNALMTFLCDIEVKGREHLEALEGPALFVANHQSYLDAPVVLRVLPRHIRKRMAIAAWQEYFMEWRNPLWRVHQLIAYNFATLFYNVYMFPQKAGYRDAFEYTGELVDHKWHIFLFPEGQRTLTGEIQSFKPGVGLLTPALDIPVVPVHIDGLHEVLPRGSVWPKPGKVRVTFGKPFRPRAKKAMKITEEIEKKVRKL